MQKIILEIETGDIDDTIALIYALMNPNIDVLALCVYPGSRPQLGCIQKLLQYINYKKPLVLSSFDSNKEFYPSVLYERVYGKYSSYDGPLLSATDTVIKLGKEHNDITFVSLGPPKVLAAALKKDEGIKVDRWVAQGGFAGVGVMDEDKILEKFKGLVECPTWNLGGAVKEAKYMLRDDRIGIKNFVAKNVCHGIVYDTEFHKKLQKAAKMNSFASYFVDIMEKAYGKGKSMRKKIHDILPLMTCTHGNICTFREVHLYYNKKKSAWGSYLAGGTNVFISVDYDKELYWDLLVDPK